MILLRLAVNIKMSIQMEIKIKKGGEADNLRGDKSVVYRSFAITVILIVTSSIRLSASKMIKEEGACVRIDGQSSSPSSKNL